MAAARGVGFVEDGVARRDAAQAVRLVDRIERPVARQVAEHQSGREARAAEIEGAEERGVECEGVGQPLLEGKGTEEFGGDAGLLRHAVGAAQHGGLGVAGSGIAGREVAAPAAGAEVGQLGGGGKLRGPAYPAAAHAADRAGEDLGVVHIGEERDAGIADIGIARGRCSQRKAPAVREAQGGAEFDAAERLSDARNGQVAVECREVVVAAAGLRTIEAQRGEGRELQFDVAARAAEGQLGRPDALGAGIGDRAVVVEGLVEERLGEGRRGPCKGGQRKVAARREGPADEQFEAVGRKVQAARGTEGERPGEELLLVVAPAADRRASQFSPRFGMEAVGAVDGPEEDAKIAAEQCIVVTEAVARADLAVGVAQVVLEQVAVGVVVDQVLVDIREV